MKIHTPLLALLSTVLARAIEDVDTIDGVNPHLALVSSKKVRDAFAICSAEGRECLIFGNWIAEAWPLPFREETLVNMSDSVTGLHVLIPSQGSHRYLSHP